MMSFSYLFDEMLTSVFLLTTSLQWCWSLLRFIFNFKQLTQLMKGNVYRATDNLFHYIISIHRLNTCAHYNLFQLSHKYVFFIIFLFMVRYLPVLLYLSYWSSKMHLSFLIWNIPSNYTHHSPQNHSMDDHHC
jgi:hypothetical protein